MAKLGGSYRHISATNEFKELERLRFLAKSNEASALGHAMQQGMQQGIQQGMQKVFALLEEGYSLTEAKKKLQLI